MGVTKSVVVAVDGSEESMKALEWALHNVRGCDEEEKRVKFTALHVQSPPTIAVGLNPGAIPFGGPENLEVPAFTAAIEAHQRKISEAIMAHAEEIWTQKNINVEKLVVVGEPKQAICEIVSKLQANLLVMGCRSFGPIARMFVGSVSSYCLNHATCPVTIVKEK